MGSSMTALLIIAVTALFTFLTRAVPFLFFGGKKLLRPGFYFSAEYFHRHHRHFSYLLSAKYYPDSVSLWYPRNYCGSDSGRTSKI